ncbi:hypothetical protein [Micromonospora sp. Llam0]|uniref:hypothetical protein n=1 Tax=Micromonospora sp. Llam0 TaxID=2485143 RepID=UPI000F49E270|nr:hypothetical protein [Micromonospora sp. Llam0]
MIVDKSFDADELSRYILTRVHHVDGQVLWARIRRDHAVYQYAAAVEVLTPNLTWTTLAIEPRATWYPNTPEYADDEDPLTDVADRLLAHARTILAGLPSPGC